LTLFTIFKTFYREDCGLKEGDIKIILIDGDQLAQLLIDNNVGVSTLQTYEVKRLDSDYFTGE
jgi:restriction endonuclease Mrr